MLISPFNFFSFSRDFNFCWYHSQIPRSPIPTVLSIVLFLWLNGWSRHIWCAILLNDNMDLHMSNLGTLVPEGPWCVLCSKSHNVVFYWYSDLVSHTQTHKHTQHTQGPVDWQTLINIYLHQYIYWHCYVLTATTFITLND